MYTLGSGFGVNLNAIFLRAKGTCQSKFGPGLFIGDKSWSRRSRSPSLAFSLPLALARDEDVLEALVVVLAAVDARVQHPAGAVANLPWVVVLEADEPAVGGASLAPALLALVARLARPSS